MASKTFEKFRGLLVQRNSMTSDAGALEEADNVTLVYDNLITKRRGYTKRAEFPTGQVIKHMFEYQSDIFALSQNALYRLQTTAATGTAASANGSFTVTVTKAAHGLTTGDYISQFEVSDEDTDFYDAFPNRQADFTGTFLVTVTGANTFTIQALTLATASVTTAAGMASYVYYTRMTSPALSVTDGGVANPRSVIENKNAYFLTDNGTFKLERNDLPALKAGIPQGLDLDGLLDKTPAGNYTGFFSTAGQIAYRVVFGRRDANSNLVLGAPSEFLILANTKNVAGGVSYASPDITVTYTAHGLAIGDIVTIYDDADITPAIPDGFEYFVKAVPTADTFTIEVGAGYVLGAAPALSFTYAQTPQVYASIPSEIDSTEYLVQVYRTDVSATQDTVPDQQYLLVTEQNLTSAQITARVFDFIDELPEEVLGADLYTNSTVEGEGQANYRPPFAKDIANFKNYTFFANIKDVHRRELAVVAPNNIQSNDGITVAGHVYLLRRNAGDNNAVVNEVAISSATRVGATVTVTQTGHGFSNNDVIYVFENTALGITAGTFSITVTGANTFTFASVGAAVTADLTYEGRTSGAGLYLAKAWLTGSGIDTTISEAIQNTAKSIVKAINRRTTSTIYAQYLSGITDAPGKMVFSAKNLNAASFACTANVALCGQAFFPILPTTGTTISSSQTTVPNQLSISKDNEPEAVPLLNTAYVGSESKAILRIATLRDSLIIIKEDGVFRLNGDTPANFSAIPIDTTVFCKAENSVAVLNNSVYCLSNQGVVEISESSVRVVSRDIEPLLSSVLNNTSLSAATAAVGYESDRHYILATLKPNTTGSVANTVYVFNYLTEAWTRWDATFKNGFLYPQSDSTYITTTTGNVINQERKTQKKTDFTGQDFGIPVYRGAVAYITCTSNTAAVTVNTIQEHGLLVGDLVTVKYVAPSVAILFAGGAGDVQGLRSVTSVTGTKQFTFNAATNSLGTTTRDQIEYQAGISEFSLAASASLGTSTVTITTPIAHGLTTGESINVDISSGLATAFPTPSDVEGFRTVTVLTATTFSISASSSAPVAQNGTLVITDKRQENYYVTLQTPSTVTPEVGDAIIYQSQLYKIVELNNYSNTRYLAKLNFEAVFLSSENTKLYSSYQSRVKLSPVTMGDSGKLKYFSMFQTQFRQSGNCSRLTVDYACDSKTTTGQTVWRDAVGTGEAQTVFQGWGEIAFGEEPWGGGESINRTFTTSPAIIMRTLVNLDAFTSTFIQPILTHRVAGEEINIQAMSLDFDFVSTNTTR